jgi:cyclophilin family peptidyl-prolyl cis-trans isomerase
VLQCGDPTGDGTGGPGYTMQDENPTHLKPSASAAGAVVYPRGAVAMAKTAEPDSAGSQFFLVYGDSEIPPDYAVFGRIDEAGLGILDKVATGGVEPANGPDDGSPKLTVKITKAVIP